MFDLVLPPATRNDWDMSRWEIRVAIALSGAVFVGGFVAPALAAPVKATTEVLAVDALATFTRGQGTSSLVPIDHVVAVSDAWQKGAFKWDAVRRINFYNDPLNLLATQRSLNSQKRDGDAATWLPQIYFFPRIRI